MLDPDTEPYLEVDRELARLQRRYRFASHEVAERGVRPDGIDDATLAWWIAAHRARHRRRHERSDTIAITQPVDKVELRKSRLRKPSGSQPQRTARRALQPLPKTPSAEVDNC